MDQTGFQGRTIKGYELVELVGQGGFGAVYRAHQALVGREVAFKIILPEYANQPAFIRRFDAEAQVIARLEHFHIVPLYDYWREPDGAYLVMRWLRGGNLRTRLSKVGRLETSVAAKVLEQIASALAVAHRQGVVHRDIKPDNILLDEEDNAYLADFGIAIDRLSTVPPLESDIWLGSPPYMSPEQVLGQMPTPQSDIYSLGIVLYELLTGKVPFSAPTDVEVMRLHLGQPVAALQTIVPDLPAALNYVIWHATAKALTARYTNILDLAKDFRQALVESERRQESQSAYPPVPAPGLLADPQTVDLNTPPPTPNPYKGLRSFQEADAVDFFGRDKLVNQLVECFGVEGDKTRFLAVVGPSGSGKSSVVKAGLIPVLRKGAIAGSDTWFYAQMVPGNRPFEELASVLLQVAANAPPNLRQELSQDEGGLSRLVSQILPPGETELFLLIDQFEELFTLVESESERALFLKSLQTALMSLDSRFRLVVTLRADFYDRPLLYAGFGDMVRDHTEVVLPLSPSELSEAIRGPAERVGLLLEPGLVAAIVADVNNEPGALPLLQYALTELFEHRQQNNLTLAGYEAIGSVSSALARRADEVYESLNLPAKEMAQQLFLRLINIGENAEVTRRRVSQAELISLIGDKQLIFQVMEAFAKYRLLTFDRELVTRAPTVELAHEALIREWDQLRTWRVVSQDDLRVQRHVSAATTEWINGNRDVSFLASGSRLAQFETLLESKFLALNKDELAYVKASIEMRQRVTNRTRIVIAVLTIFSFVTLALAGVAFDSRAKAQSAQATTVVERDRADSQARLASSRALAVTALTNLDQIDRSLLLSVGAMQIADTFEARNSLFTALQYRPRLSRFYYGHVDAVRTLAFSPDGSRLASGSRDQEILLWDIASGKPILPALKGHAGSINSIAFSPDGRLLASGSLDGTVRLWDAETGQSMGDPLVLAEPSPIWSLSFSPDGSLLATGNADSTIRIWEVAERKLLHSLRGHTDIVYSVAFSPDGQWLATGGSDNAVRLWDTQTGSAVGDPLLGHSNWVLTVAFSPDGRLLASSGADSQITLWNLATHEKLFQFPSGHNDWVRKLAFDPTGRFLASGSADSLIKIWDVMTGQETTQPLAGHTDQVWDVAFDPSGRTLVSAGVDKTIIRWDVTQTYRVLGHAINGYSEAISSVAFSPDGKSLVSSDGDPAGIDHALRLWDVATGELQGILKGHVGPITEVSFSPTGSLIASASADQTIRLWDPSTKEAAGDPLIGHTKDVWTLDFSPQGDVLASGSVDGSIILWDVKTRKPMGQPLLGHEAGVLSVDFSPDGRLIASGSRDHTVLIWDVASRQSITQPLVGHQDYVERVVFSPDGNWLASGSRDGSIILWDAHDYQSLGQPLIAHTDYVLDLAFSPDSRLLASSGADDRLILWDIAAGRPLGRPITGHTDFVSAVAFSPDGNVLASGSFDRTLILWDMSLNSWQDRACYIANRPLSQQELELYLSGISIKDICSNSQLLSQGDDQQ